MAGEWVLTGRAEELAFALDVLTQQPDLRGLVITGVAGVGKSRLADEVVDRLPEDWVVRRAVATASAGIIPFGAFSHLLDGDEPGADGRLEPRDLLWALRTIRQQLLRSAGGGSVIVVVDDAHSLDKASATLVQQIALAHEARVLLTVRSGEQCPESIAALWREGVCGQLDLQALSRGEVGELAAKVLGTWFEQASIDRLHTASGGNPLLLRELLAEATDEERLDVHRGLLRWAGVAGTPRLVSLVARELDNLDPEGGDLVDCLALGEPIPVAVARQLATLPTIAGLEQSGLVRVDQFADGQVRLAHPLFGEVRRTQLGPLRVEVIESRLADGFEAAGRDHPDEQLRVVSWRLASGAPVDPTTLFEAALHARDRGDNALAERLVRAASPGGEPPQPALALLLAEILEVTGRPREAADLLDGLAGRLDTDAERARAVSARLRVLVYGLHRVDLAEVAASEARHVQDPVWRGFVEAQWATLLATVGRVAEAEALGVTLFAQPDARVQLRALPAVNVAAYAAGRLEEALATSQAMVGPALVHRDDVPAGLDVVFSALALDLLALGRFDELEALLDTVDSAPTVPGSARAYLLLVRGAIALRRGSVSAARRALAEAVELFEQADPARYRSVALARLAEAAVHAGDRAAACQAADECSAALADQPGRLIDIDSRRSLAWVDVVDGDVNRARRRLVEIARAARSDGHTLFEADCLYDAFRLGGAGRSLARLDEVLSTIQGPRAALLRAHVAAVRSNDPAALEEVAGRVEESGELLLAAEVYADAARRARDVGLEPRARRLEARARACVARCPGALFRLDLGAVESPLTARELQVARLAAGGSSSQAIADTLGVSRRTVDNQLSRVYAKLGIRGRSELSEAISAVDSH